MFVLDPMLEDVYVISGLVIILRLTLFDCSLHNVNETPTL
jgi:hypothetical protein